MSKSKQELDATKARARELYEELHVFIKATEAITPELGQRLDAICTELRMIERGLKLRSNHNEREILHNTNR